MNKIKTGEMIINIGVIVLNYNGPQHTMKCIQSLKLANAMFGQLTIHIIVVDNASTDGSIAMLREIDDITFLQSAKNGGFSWGCNIGLKYCKNLGYDYVILLNNDASISPDSFSSMIKLSQQYKDKCIISPIIYNLDNTIQSCGGKISAISGRVNLHKETSTNIKVEFLTGCCLFIPNQVLNDVGLLDERFFMYWEDIDYSFRASSKGYYLLIDENAKVYHVDSASTKNIPYLKEKYYNASQKAFMLKYKCYRRAVTNVVCRVIRSLITGKWYRIKAVFIVWILNKEKVVL